MTPTRTGRCRAVLLAAAATGALAWPVAADPVASRLDPRARAALAVARARAGDRRAPVLSSRTDAAVRPDGTIDVFVTGEASRAALEAAGARVRTVLPGVCTASVPAAALERVAALPGVRGVHAAVALEPLLDLSAPWVAATPQRGPAPAFDGANGEGVIVGLVDSGVDHDHPDLLDDAGTTRLIAAWDQTVFSGVPPSPYDYGAVWSRAQFAAGLSTLQDLAGHGTHVIGIAAGDGSGGTPAGAYVGVAPRADLLAVKSYFQTTQLVDGVAWMFERAAELGRPAIVNLSIGGHYGPHDGTSPLEQALTALTGPGRLIVAAAGNSRRDRSHAEIRPVSGVARATFAIDGARLGQFVAINGFYDAGDSMSLVVRGPLGTRIGPLRSGEIHAPYPGTCGPDGCIYVENGFSRTATGDRWVYVEIAQDDGSAIDGSWTFELVPDALGPAGGEVDLWHYFQLGNMAADFVTGVDVTSELVTEPACADSVIAVAAFTTRTTWEDCGGRGNLSFFDAQPPGRLATFSSPGPRRDGVQKPEIAAPGSAIASTLTGDLGLDCPPSASVLLTDGAHYMSEGTSMAAPHVAGALALLMQRHGPVGTAEAVAWLARHAERRTYMGPLPNGNWGHGMLRLPDLVAPRVDARIAGGDRFATGDTVEIAWRSSDRYGAVVSLAAELSRDGVAGSWEPIAEPSPADSVRSWIATGPPCADCRIRVVARDSSGNSGADTTAAFAIELPLPPAEPAVFALSEIAPNPASGPVTVRFSLPTASRARVSVLDLGGRRVATLLDAALDPGPHAVVWNGASGRHTAPPGVYVVQLEAGAARARRRVALLR